MELDDTHDSSISHPGAAVIAAALAVGAHENINGKKVMPAIVAGYEAIGRIGRAVGADDVIEYGYHPTALFGGFGVAVTVGKLLGLSCNGISSAWGLLLSMAGGSMQFSEDPFGTSLKNLNLEVRSGEILGIGGVSGNGQEELMTALSGELPPRKGKIFSLSLRQKV